jgi:catalase
LLPNANLFRKMTTEQRQALFENTATSMNGVPTEIQQRRIGHCALADPAYGAGVAAAKLRWPQRERKYIAARPLCCVEVLGRHQ